MDKTVNRLFYYHPSE